MPATSWPGSDVELAGVGNDTMLESYVLDSVGARRHQLEDVAKKYLGRGKRRATRHWPARVSSNAP